MNKHLLVYWTLAGLALAGAACQTPAPLIPAQSPVATVVPVEAATAAVATGAPATNTESAPDAPTEPLAASGEEVEIASDGKTYPSYLAAPTGGGPYPGVVLVHSINGLEQGYKTMSDKLAAEGFVVLALGWQTYERTPPDPVVLKLVEDTVAYLSSRDDVDPERLGLTGFCAGGRYTMLLLPQIKSFKAGVAWYGFPYRGSPSAADLIGDLDAPLFVIHGTADSPSPIADVERYVVALEAAGKTHEFQVYNGEPHGFMLQGGQMRDDDIARDAFGKMIAFFKRTLE